VSTFAVFWSGLTLVVAALSFGPTFAHLLEAPPRLLVWSPELWREATVFNGQFRLFGLVGGPLDVILIPVAAVLAFLLRHDRSPFLLALAGMLLFAVSLALWLSIVAPANATMATWQHGPLPADFEATRTRWETGHILMAAVKFLGLVALVAAIAVEHSESAAQ